MRGPGGRAPLLGTPKDMPSKVLEMGVCFHWNPILRNTKGHPFLRASERREKFLIYGNFYERFERYEKGPVNRCLSP